MSHPPMPLYLVIQQISILMVLLYITHAERPSVDLIHHGRFLSFRGF